MGLLILFVAVCSGTVRATPSTSAFLQEVKTHYIQWDADKDGTLSVNEVELALDNPAIKGAEAAAIASLRRGWRAKGIKSSTLEELGASLPYDSRAKPAPPNYESMYKAALAKIGAAKMGLFATGTPQLGSLSQGRLGDCFLLAALGAYVNHDPQGLEKMMQVQPDGKVAVAFGTGQIVTLPSPTHAEVVIGASTHNQGTWANMFEKAVGHILLGRQKTERHVAPYSIIGVGGSPHTVLQLITGHKVVRLGCEDIRKKGIDPAERESKLAAMRTTLIETQKAGRMIVSGNGPIARQAIVPGLYYNHSYAVLGYDSAADTVTFWNPFGNKYVPKGEPGLRHGYLTSQGRFTVPLTETVEWLGSFSIETDQPLGGETSVTSKKAKP